MERMAMEYLEARRLYSIRSRNLIVGVWNPAAHGFIGIRNKFGSDYLFTEYHWDWDAHCGTVSHMEPMDFYLPDNLELEEYKFICKICYGRVAWKDDPIKAYVHIEPNFDHGVDQAFLANDAMFEWMMPFHESELLVRYGDR